MKSTSIIICAFTTIGIGFLITAVAVFINTQNFLKDAISTEGTVTELVRSRSGSESSSSNSVVYRPVIEFKTRDGNLVEFTSSTGSNPPSYSMGESVGIFYHKSSPERAKTDDYFSLWGATTIFGLFGVVFFLVGLVPILLERSWGNKFARRMS